MFYKEFYVGENIFTVIEDKYDFKYKLKEIDGRIYIPFGLVKKYIDSYIFCDREKNKIIITDEKDVLRLELNRFEYKLNENEKN